MKSPTNPLLFLTNMKLLFIMINILLQKFCCNFFNLVDHCFKTWLNKEPSRVIWNFRLKDFHFFLMQHSSVFSNFPSYRNLYEGKNTQHFAPSFDLFYFFHFRWLIENIFLTFNIFDMQYFISVYC